MEKKHKSKYKGHIFFILLSILLTAAFTFLYLYNSNYSFKPIILLYHTVACAILFVLLIITWIFQYSEFKEMADEIAGLDEYNEEILRGQSEKEELITSLSEKKQVSDNNLEDYNVLNDIFNLITEENKEVSEISDFALNKILTLPGLNVTGKAVLFLKNDRGDLIFSAKKNIADLTEDYKIIKPGKCICGKTISGNDVQICNENIFPEFEYGRLNHINIPLLINDQTHGILYLFIESGYSISEKDLETLKKVSSVLAFIILRKQSADKIKRAEEEIDKKNKSIRKYEVNIEQKLSEQEVLYQTILTQKKQAEQRSREIEKQNNELISKSAELDNKAKELEAKNQDLFAQKMELEQKNIEVLHNTKELENSSKKTEGLNQELFAQKMELEQQKIEAENYSKELEEKAKELEVKNQELFAQKMEMEQKNIEILHSSKDLEKKAKELEALNQDLFAQKMELEQKNTEVVIGRKELEEKGKKTEALNQELFAQKMELVQEKSEAQKHFEDLNKKAKELEGLNQELFAQKMESEQKDFQTSQITSEVEEKSKELDVLNRKLFAQEIEIENYKNELNKLKNNTIDDIESARSEIPVDKTEQIELISEEEIDKILPHSFVIHKPKDIVASDYYYMKKHDNIIVFAVVDSNVTDSQSTILAKQTLNFLDNMLANVIRTPANALKLLRDRLKDSKVSHDDASNNNVYLDISLCFLNTENMQLMFSSTYNSALIIRNNEITELETGKNPIIFSSGEKMFEDVEINLLKNDSIYLFSDGFVEQTGGTSNKKFSRKKFYELLIDVHTYPANEQNNILEEILEKWQGENGQDDDITVMGVRI